MPNNSANCPFNTDIKFLTPYGWLTGKRVNIVFSYGAETSLFVADKTDNNKLWGDWSEGEVYNWELI